MIEILETDTKFFDSPDAGHPECKCSRCLQPIPEDDCPLRIWPSFPDDEDFEPAPEDDYEYRFCEPCMEAAGMTVYPNREERKIENELNFDRIHANDN